MSEHIHKITHVIASDLLQVLPVFVTGRTAVLLTGENIEGVLCTKECVIVNNFQSCHPVWREIMSNLKIDV